MNPNRPVDEFGREEITITSVVEVKSATGETVSTNLLLDGNPVAEANPLPVAVTNELTVGFASPPAVEVNNFPTDPPTATNQASTNTKLDTVITKLNGGLPNALVDGLLGVQEANSTLIRSDTAAINAKLPTTTTVDLVHNSSGLPVRPISEQYQCIKTTPGTEALYLVVSAAPCWLSSFFIINESPTRTYYITVYNQTTAPTGGAAATNRVLPGAYIDSSSAGDPFFFEKEFSKPIYLSTGCVIALESSSNPANTTYGTSPGAVLSACFLPA